MAYNKNYRYNNNRNRAYNKGYKNYNGNSANVIDMHERFENKNGFDARQFKKPDIEIIDLNGKAYTINGNFSTPFSIEMMKYIDKVESMRDGANDLENLPEMLSIMKEWCLSLINMNVDGTEYTMKDVERGFNDVYVLYNLMNYISEIMTKNTNEKLPVLKGE